MDHTAEKNDRRKTTTEVVGDKIKSIDSFGQQFELNLDGKTTQTSYMGTFLTIILSLTALAFLYGKYLTIAEKQQVDIMSSLMENFHSDDYKFKGENGFFIAAALTNYDNNKEIIEEARYGTLTMEYYGWGNSDGDSIGVEAKPLEYHYCSDEELGITRTPETNVYPWFEKISNEVMTYRKKFKCIDKEDTVIWGDYNSAKTQQIAIRFRMCEGGEANGCETEADTREWLKRKFIVIMYNHKRFLTEGFFDDATINESKLFYIPISSQTKQIVPFKVQQTHLELQDTDTIQLDDVTKDAREDLFRLAQQQVLPYEFNDNAWSSVTIEMDLNVIHNERQVYTIFDMLSDFGGLTGILTSIFAIITSAWNYQAFENFIASRLYKIQKPESQINLDMHYNDQSEHIKIGFLPSFKSYLLSWFPSCCTDKCKGSRKEVALQMAREQLENETNIIEMVQQTRYLSQAINLLMTQHQRAEVQDRARFIAINPEQEMKESGNVKNPQVYPKKDPEDEMEGVRYDDGDADHSARSNAQLRDKIDAVRANQDDDEGPETGREKLPSIESHLPRIIDYRTVQTGTPNTAMIEMTKGLDVQLEQELKLDTLGND